MTETKEKIPSKAEEDKFYGQPIDEWLVEGPDGKYRVVIIERFKGRYSVFVYSPNKKLPVEFVDRRNVVLIGKTLEEAQKHAKVFMLQIPKFGNVWEKYQYE